MDKKTVMAMFGISVFAGLGYLAWATTPVGKSALSKWLLKKWGEMAEQRNKKIDKKQLAPELKKLSYRDHELLVRYTLFDPFGKEMEGKLDAQAKKKLDKLMRKMATSGIFKKADLTQLKNFVLPG